MWRIISYALLTTVAVSSAIQTSSYRDMIEQIFRDFLPVEMSPNAKRALERTCQRYADNETFNNFMSVWSNVVQDIPASTMREAAKYLKDGETLKSLDIYCRLSPKMKTSSNKMLYAFKGCVEPDRREEFDYHMNVLTFDSFLNFICFNSSEIVKSFIQNGGEECMKERESELSQCHFAEWEDKILNEIVSKTSESINTMTEEEFKKARNDRECRVKKIFQTCVKKELDQCPSPSTSNFIVGLMDRMPEPLCKEHSPN